MADLMRNKVQDIRNVMVRKLAAGEVASNGTLEITGANFIADEDFIFGNPSADYIEKELMWYLDENLSIQGLAPGIPKIWQDVACKDGLINSNYGWCIFSEDNGDQFTNAVNHLAKDKSSRQAVMVYTRPSIHTDAFTNGRKDFICTNAVQLLIRGGKLEYHVSMRSNDVVYGYNNDVAWHRYVHGRALASLSVSLGGLEIGDMHWSAGSLHVYPRHFNLVVD